MLVTNHVLAGAVIGTALRRRPALAFGLGVASHLAMDALPHWGLPRGPESHARFLRVAYRDGTVGLATLCALGARATGGQRRVVLAGMAGAVLLDIDKPARHFFGRNPVPERIQRFHEDIQREAPHRMPGEFIAAAALLAVAAGLLRRARD